MNKYKDLIIWKKSMELAKVVYMITDKFPSDERYGIVNQMRRAAVSIASNIAEGAGRESNKEFNYFLSVSNGSSYELQTQLIISADINLLNPEMRHLYTKWDRKKSLYCIMRNVDKINLALEELSKKYDEIEEETKNRYMIDINNYTVKFSKNASEEFKKDAQQIVKKITDE